MIETQVKGIYKFRYFNGVEFVNFYLLEEDKTLIDCGSLANRKEVLNDIRKIMDPKEIQKILFTHLHYDHSQNCLAFPNSKLFASLEEIEDFKINPGTVVYGHSRYNDVPTTLDNVVLDVLPNQLGDIKVIKTPGHTRGSVCFFYRSKGILFSGDTYLKNGNKCADFFENSKPLDYDESISRILSLNAKHIFDGHT